MTNPQPPVKGKGRDPSDPMYVEVAKIKLALGDLYLGAADSLPRWMAWLTNRLYRKAYSLYQEGYKILKDWERTKP